MTSQEERRSKKPLELKTRLVLVLACLGLGLLALAYRELEGLRPSYSSLRVSVSEDSHLPSRLFHEIGDSLPLVLETRENLVGVRFDGLDFDSSPSKLKVFGSGGGTLSCGSSQEFPLSSDIRDPVCLNSNTLTLKLRNNGSRLALDLRGYNLNSQVYLLLGASLLVSALVLSTRLTSNLGPWGAGILISGILLRLAYWLNTPSWLRSYDWAEHQEYIQYFLELGGLPEPSLGWQFYQMPLFYIFSANSFQLLSLFIEKLSLSFFLEGLSLIISMLTFLVALAISSNQANKSTRVLVLALFAFSPPLLRLSAQVTNDSFVCLFSLLAVYYLCHPNLSKSNSIGASNPLLACLAACIASLSKFSGLMLFPCIAFAYFKKIKSLTLLALLSLGLAPSLALNYLRNRGAIIGEFTESTLSPHLRLDYISLKINPLNWRLGGHHIDSATDYFIGTYLHGEFFSQAGSFVNNGLVISSLILFSILFLNVLRLRTRLEVGLLLLVFTGIASMSLLVLKHPFRPCLDFRLVISTLAPLYLITAKSLPRGISTKLQYLAVFTHSFFVFSYFLDLSFY